MFFSSCSSNFLRKSEISYIAKLTRLSLKQQILFRVGHTIILFASRYLVPNHRLVLEVLKRCVTSTCSKKLDEVILDRSLCDSSIHNTHFSDCWYNTNIRDLKVPSTEEIARAKKPPKEHKMIMANLVPPTEEIARAKKPPKGHKMTVKTKFSKVTLNPKFSKASVKFLKKRYRSLQKKGRDFQKFLWGRKRN